MRDDLVEQPDAANLHEVLLSVADADDEWRALAAKILDAAMQGISVTEFADSLGLSQGVSGYVYHTVPVAVYAWYRHFGDFESTVQEVLNCGGDTDTAGAIAGALAGCVTGESGIPADWLAGLVDWPRSKRILREIADRVCVAGAPGKGPGPVPYFWLAMPARNAVCFVMTFAHLVRRLAPPY